MIDHNRISGVLDAVRAAAPLIHNLTNNVVWNDSADAIAALGATQATVHNVEESADLAGIASAVSVNLETPNALWTEAARIAAGTARDVGKPWVLDPVAVGLLSYRTALAAEFQAMRPTVVKGNASKIMALSGEAAKTHGADSQHAPDDAADAARSLAAASGAVVAVTGPVDLVTDGAATVRIANGHPLMPKVIGTGCMLTPLVAACVAVAASPFEGTVAALALFAIAGELAGKAAVGPGTIKPRLLDSLYGLDAAQVESRLNLA